MHYLRYIQLWQQLSTTLAVGHHYPTHTLASLNPLLIVLSVNQSYTKKKKKKKTRKKTRELNGDII